MACPLYASSHEFFMCELFCAIFVICDRFEYQITLTIHTLSNDYHRMSSSWMEFTNCVDRDFVSDQPFDCASDQTPRYE